MNIQIQKRSKTPRLSSHKDEVQTHKRNGIILEEYKRRNKKQEAFD